MSIRWAVGGCACLVLSLCPAPSLSCRDSASQYKATLVCNVINILLEPLFIFTFGWGVKGAAAAVALSQVGTRDGIPPSCAVHCFCM